ncbi:ribosome small subunit-dependent GTPase A [Ferroacidibacillus organovorans]|nr:ribosome small subunit-dependent GTPase A [Ferroacidibacillus organovorans]
MRGKIVRAVSGFYYVQTDAGTTLQCRARGIFKKRGIKPLVGDQVDVEAQGTQEGVIVEIAPRVNKLERPSIANVDQVFVVLSLLEPELSLYQLDKMIAMVEEQNLPLLLVLTKAELPGAIEVFQRIEPIYRAMQYELIALSLRAGIGNDTLAARLKNKTTVLAGLSGVGKSTILRFAVPGADVAVGSISEKGLRGKHTTTFVELYQTEDGFIADSPGFSQYSFEALEPEQIQYLFRDIKAEADQCVFRGCLHETEDGCAVRRARDEGRLAATRYTSYRQVLHEVKDAKNRRY